MNIVNISCYKFVELQNLEDLKLLVKSKCDDLELRGTVLLGEEGVNLMLAGTREGTDGFKAFMNEHETFNDLKYKESFTISQPFQRMVVKIKKEIVTMGVDNINPEKDPAPSISAKDFKEWMDEGRDFTILDVRNDYEVNLGTFDNAIHLDIQNFRSFPNAAHDLDDDIREKPVVIFCTGGIRCEKGAPQLIKDGFKEVYQLEGGILKYFQECGGDHYQGECFVFDDRVAVNDRLEETTTNWCNTCQKVVASDDPALPKPMDSCPACDNQTQVV